jgi:hypothetical protein
MWHKSLQDETKNAFKDIYNSSLKDMQFIYMKNIDGRFGLCSRDEIARQNVIHVIDRDATEGSDDNVYPYNSIQSLIDSGWIVD